MDSFWKLKIIHLKTPSMPSPISQLQQKLLVVICGVIALALILISVMLVATQFSEVSSKNEMLSLT